MNKLGFTYDTKSIYLEAAIENADRNKAQVRFEHGDAFAPGAFADATCVVMIQLASRAIFARFLDAFAFGDGDDTGGTRPPLRWVVTARRIPDDLLAAFNNRHAHRAPRAALRRVETLDTTSTWAAHLVLHVYRADFADFPGMGRAMHGDEL